MPYSVSSWFYEQAMSKNPSADIVRNFTIATSDYSNRVTKWPTFKTSWDKVRETKLNIPLANEDGVMNFIKDDKTKMISDCVVSFGFSRTAFGNMHTYSEQFDHANWAKSGVTVTASAEIAPDDTYTADLITAVSSTYSGFFKQSIVMSGDNKITVESQHLNMSIYVLEDTSPEVTLRASAGGGLLTLRYEFATNSFTTEIGCTGSVTDVGSNWLRIALATAQTNSSYGFEFIYFPTGHTDSASGSAYFWGAQATLGKYLEDYQVTTSTQGVSYVTSETIELFSGNINNVKYSRGLCSITVADKFKQLSERVVGTSDNPVAVTGNILPSDIAWWAVTSYGGMDTTQSTSNTDINWDSFQAWAAVFSGDSVYMNTNFKGIKVTEVLRKISRQTQSAIFIQENKINFHRFSIADSNTTELNNTEIKDLSLSFDDNDTVNKQYVYADYDVDSSYFTTTVYDTSSSSVNSFGLKEDTIKDESLWYVGSGSAINMAQRITSVHGSPYDKFDVYVPAVGVLHQIGETVSIMDSQLVETTSFRGLHKTINLDNLSITLSGDKSQLNNSFILDITSLDGTEVLI